DRKRPNVIPECLPGRDPSRGRVGLREIALILQVSHRVADRSRTQAIAAPLRDRTRPDGFAGFDVLSNDGVQDFLTATGQWFPPLSYILNQNKTPRARSSRRTGVKHGVPLS